MATVKKMTAAELKQCQAVLGWSNAETADRLGVSLKTVVNWRADAARIPAFLREALAYHIAKDLKEGLSNV